MKNYNIGSIIFLITIIPTFVCGKVDINITEEPNKQKLITNIYNVNETPGSVIHHNSIEVHYDLIYNNKELIINKKNAPRMIIWNDITGNLVDQHLIDTGQDQVVTFNNLEINVPYRVELIARYNLESNPNNTSVYMLNEQQFVIDGNQIYGGHNPDEFYSVIKTSDGGYIAVGKINNDEESGKFASSSDGLLVKFDREGNSMWAQVYHKKRINNFYTIIETNDGGYAIAGETSNNSDPQSINTNNAGLLVKFDNSGNLIWDKVYQKNDSSGFYSLIENSNGEYVVVGYSVRNNQELENGYHQKINDALLVKFDDKGRLIWEKNHGGDDHSEFYSIIETDDRGYFVVGMTKQDEKESELHRGNNIDAISVQFDSEGNFVWDRIYKGSKREEFYLVVKNNEGEYSLTTEVIDNEGNDNSVPRFPTRLF